MTGHTPTARSRVLVLGGSGLLGQACVEIFRTTPGLTVDATDRHSEDPDLRIDVRVDAGRLWALLDRHNYDLVVNAIGILRDRIDAERPGSIREAIAVNAAFPHALAARCEGTGARVVHISTDAVFSRGRAPHDELARPMPADPYAASKWLGEPHSPAAVTLRCSIVGRHPVRATGLLEWFRRLPEGARVEGYADYRWTPVTTVQVARLCVRLADPRVFDDMRALSRVLHFAPNPPLSKWEMLELLNERRGRTVVVRKADHPEGAADLSLTTRFEAFRQLSAEPRPWPAVLSEVWQ